MFLSTDVRALLVTSSASFHTGFAHKFTDNHFGIIHKFYALHYVEFNSLALQL